MKGFIKLHRDIKNWKWADCPHAMSLWIHILVGAYWSDGYYKGILIKRGQYPTTTYQLAEEVGIHRHTVRGWLKKFEEDNQITIKSTNKFSVITVINYEKYHCQEDKVIPQDIPQVIPQDIPPINLKEDKEDKEDKDYIYSAREKSSIAKQVLDHLNRKTGKSFKYSKSSLDPIVARLNEGYTMAECMKVIDIKFAEWNSDAHMKQYLAPDTLFRASKFPRYLNQQVEVERSKGIDFDALNPDDWE